MVEPRYSDALGHGLTDKRIDILRGIGRTGSISQAAREAAVSYKAAWQAIDTLSNLAGVALVERVVGGAGGGGARLTPQGLQLLSLAEELGEARRALHARRDMAGGAGGNGGKAHLGAHALAGLSGLALRTSMRNQLPALVRSLEGSGHVVRVILSLGDGQIAARITRESAQLLGLEPGMAVIALCKATAVRVSRPAESELATLGGNVLQGTVGRLDRSESGDEVSVTLSPGLQLVGFAEAHSGLRARQRVVAWVDEAAVVVALGA
ncbi:TOBE domain-containing protein [Variovorax dokdonensis]|uniref:TOBE domain-containing protein n=1 Tax=Variovorax dokdonensis TaxID=344883 RepID=A0ABT7NC01_9BURK|nr:TOBE domain-containing protein [Variovorax dokdonensis]MDM0045481.1 TOBE domain-containing protein [Variovorax dokdonensis]